MSNHLNAGGPFDCSQCGRRIGKAGTQCLLGDGAVACSRCSPTDSHVTLTPASSITPRRAPWPHYPHCPTCHRRLATVATPYTADSCRYCGAPLGKAGGPA